MTSIDFTHSGPHDALVPGAAAEQPRSRFAVAAGCIARTIALVAFVLALFALRYWLFFPHLNHTAG